MFDFLKYIPPFDRITLCLAVPAVPFLLILSFMSFMDGMPGKSLLFMVMTVVIAFGQYVNVQRRIREGRSTR